MPTNSAGYLFRDRPPTAVELEKLRLILSTFRDGSGQQLRSEGTQPGWRDLERAVAAVTEGDNNENKGVFDVWVPAGAGDRPYGLSCKSSAVSKLDQDYVLFELHNSNAKAWGRLDELALNPREEPEAAGLALIEQVTEWHNEVAWEVDVPRSSYVVLVHDRNTWRQFRLLWYPLALDTIDPSELHWEHVGKRIQGTTADGHRLWEWYGLGSGGQLKYYPPLKIADWYSEWFELEYDVPNENLLAKAARTFPTLWTP